ncbi:MAG: response regulator, partial [Desulfobacterales bacterium]|nr:response regulator [Desulfobacterales bacterium]
SMLIGVDIDGKVTQWNKTAERSTGIAPGAARGKPLFEVFPRLGAEMGNLIESIRTREIKQERKKLLASKNGDRYEDVVIYPLVANGVEGAVIRIDDATERVRIEALALAKEKAEAANHAKSVFLANMSHEIRTPLNAVTGFSELLSSLVSDKKQKSYLDSIKTAGKSLLTLINDILDLSKIEAGMMEMEYERVNPGMIFHEIEQIFNMSITGKGLQFIIDIDDDLPSALIIDETRLRQVLVNLVGNAVKFTQKGYIRLSARMIYKKEDRSEIDLIVSVEDTGVGIPEEDQKDIFESFKQRHGQSAGKYGGTGLGLSISKRLVEMMGGRIAVSSRLGVGTTFEITLESVHAAASEGVVEDEESLDMAHITFNHAKILVVDDVESNRDLLKEILSAVELDVLTAVNGQEAILLAEEYRPDAIIMDIRMPVMDGVEATKRLKENPKTMDAPIIALTASVRSSDKNNMLKIGMDGYLAKPVRTRELLGELSRYLAHARKEAPGSPAGRSSRASIMEEIRKNPELNEIVRENIAPACGKLSQAMKMSEVKAFGEELKNLGREYNVETLEGYGAELEEAAKSYNLMDIDSILNELKKLKKSGARPCADKKRFTRSAR